MRPGLATSIAGHVLLLSWGLITLPSAEPFDPVQVEALPVDLVPIADVTKISEGKKTAEKRETASQGKAKPDLPVPQSQRVGNAPTDQKAPQTEKTTETAAAPTKEAAAPPPPPPAPKAPDPKPPAPKEPDPAPAPEPVKTPPAPAEAPAPPKAEVAELPAEPEKEQEQAEAAPAPAPAVKPRSKPKPPEPIQTASINETQTPPTEKPRKSETRKPTESEAVTPKETEEENFNPEDISALLNKVDPSGGGSRASSEEASLGSESQTGPVAEMTQDEINALKARIQECWNYPAGADGAESLRVQLRIEFNQDGSVATSPQILQQPAGPLGTVAAEGAVRAVLRCEPYGFLPPAKFETWRVVNITFDPAEMF